MARFTVSVPDGMVAVIKKLQGRWGTTRSGVMVRLLRWYEEAELERQMAEGYAAMAAESVQDAEAAQAAQAEVVLNDRSR